MLIIALTRTIQGWVLDASHDGNIISWTSWEEAQQTGKPIHFMTMNDAVNPTVYVHFDSEIDARSYITRKLFTKDSEPALITNGDIGFFGITIDQDSANVLVKRGRKLTPFLSN